MIRKLWIAGIFIFGLCPVANAKVKITQVNCKYCEEIDSRSKSLDTRKDFDSQEEEVEKAQDLLFKIKGGLKESELLSEEIVALVRLVAKLERIDGSLYSLELFLPIYEFGIPSKKKFDAEIEKIATSKAFKESLKNKLLESKGKNGK